MVSCWSPYKSLKSNWYLYWRNHSTIPVHVALLVLACLGAFIIICKQKFIEFVSLERNISSLLGKESDKPGGSIAERTTYKVYEVTYWIEALTCETMDGDNSLPCSHYGIKIKVQWVFEELILCHPHYNVYTSKTFSWCIWKYGSKIL